MSSIVARALSMVAAASGDPGAGLTTSVMEDLVPFWRWVRPR